MCTSVRGTSSANSGFVLYNQLNKARSHTHQSQINKTQVAGILLLIPRNNASVLSKTADDLID